MQITREEAARIAALAHLRFDEPGLDRMAAEMTNILSYIEQLPAAPTLSGTAAGFLSPAALRPDEPVAGLDRDTVAANAAAWVDGYFLVPRVFGG